MLRNFGKSRSQVNGFHVGRFKLIYKLGPMAGCGVSRGVRLGVGGCWGGRLINHEVSTRDVCHIRLHLEPRPQICMLFHDIVLRHTTQLRSTCSSVVWHNSVEVNTFQQQFNNSTGMLINYVLL